MSALKFSGRVAILTGLLSIQSLLAQIEAQFVDTHSSGDVDSWPGSAGDGWVSSWSEAANSNLTLTAQVTGAESGDHNHLEVSMQNTRDVPQNGVICRQYGTFSGVEPTSPRTISFVVKLDSESSSVDRLHFWEAATAGLVPYGVEAKPVWLVRSASGTWRLGDGGTSGGDLKDSGIELETDTAYRFIIEIFPADGIYNAEVKNLKTGRKFEITELRLLSNIPAEGGFLHFGATVAPEATATWTLADVTIEKP